VGRVHQSRSQPNSSAAGPRPSGSTAFAVEWVDDDLHAAGVRELERSRKGHVSLVDHISFLVMRRRDVTTAFAFDPDFRSAGFQILEG
jgi:predicted nucleic acid-binding protein